MSTTTLKQPKIVTQAEWLEARKLLLTKEKAFTRMRDELTLERGELPWVKVEKSYVFEGPDGKETLGDLFQGRSQLIVYHFMLGPDWEEGCTGCSFLSDHTDGALAHLEHHDVTLVVVSRAPLAKLEAFKERMNWKFKWVSSYGSDFNYDYHVSFTKEELAAGKGIYNFKLQDAESDEMHGTSVFAKDESGHVYHTYSAYARGCEQLVGAYHYLELTPKGRNETGPSHSLGDWVKHHDRYDAPTDANCGCQA